jgi:hypothetical protein
MLRKALSNKIFSTKIFSTKSCVRVSPGDRSSGNRAFRKPVPEDVP